MSERPWYRLHWVSLVAAGLVGWAVVSMQDYFAIKALEVLAAEILVRSLTGRFQIHLSTVFAVTAIVALLAFLIHWESRPGYEPGFRHVSSGKYFERLYVNITGFGEPWPHQLCVLVGLACTIYVAGLLAARLVRRLFHRRSPSVE